MTIFLRALGCVVLLLCSWQLRAQPSQKTSPLGDAGKKLWSNVSYSGQAGLYWDAYQLTATGGEVRPRRPDELLRLSGRFSVGFKNFSIPVSFAVSPQQTSVVLPPIPGGGQNLLSFIQNPQNAIGIAPKFKFGQVFLGTHIPRHSTFTAGDLNLFGAGFDVYTKRVRAAFSYGNTQVAIPSDILANLPGTYARRLWSGKIGYGHQDSTHLYLNLMRTFDDRASTGSLAAQAPGENAVLGLDGRWVWKNLFAQAEVAQSLYTADVRLAGFEGELRGAAALAQNLLPVPLNLTSQVGMAAKGSTGFTGQVLSMRLSLDYINVGFRSLGFPFLQPDQSNVRIEPKIKLLQGKLNIAGALGRRINNMTGLSQSRATQAVVNAQIDWQATERLSLSASYGNFGLRNTVRNDTFRVENVARSLNFSPTYTIAGQKYTHVINATASLETFDDLNLLTGAQNSNRANNLMAVYTLTWNDKPLSVDFTANRFMNQLPTGQLSIVNLMGGANYQFYQKKMKAGTKLTYARNQVGEGEPANQIMAVLDWKYNLVQKLLFGLQGSVNLYRFGSDRPGVRYRESLLRTSLVYTLK